MSCLESRMINGKTEISFNPNPQMYAFAMARGVPGHAHLDDKQVMDKIGMNGNTVVGWRRDYNPHFDEWLEGYLMTHTNAKMLKAMLESVGVQKALAGEFNFWKPLALREGVIKPDSVNLNVIPIDLGKLGDMSDSELEDARKTVMASLLPVRDEGGTGVADSPQEEGPKGDST